MKDMIKQAAMSLEEGKIVCFPTETVYALAANALNEQAIRQIYTLKGRAFDKPLSLLIKDIDTARNIANIGDTAMRLMQAFCPGPITFILPKAANCPLPAFINPGINSIGIRIPDNEIALEILRQANCPIVATSVNPSGMPEAITASQITDYFGNKIDFMIENDKDVFGRASTIVDLTGTEYKILRQGEITKEQIDAAIYS